MNNNNKKLYVIFEQIACRVVDVHEVGAGEQRKSETDDDARVEPLHQLRHQRDQHELRQAGPCQHHADLLGVVALDARQILRQDEHRAV